MLRFVRATIADKDIVVELEKEGFNDNYSEGLVVESLKNINNYIYLVYNENCLVGYVFLSIVLDTAEIIRIMVKSQYRRCGFGTMMIDTTYNKLRDKNIKELFLEVSEKNINAIGLYNKAGFKQVAKRSAYYKDSSAAIIMKLIIK